TCYFRGMRALVLVLALVPATAHADGQCTTLDVDYLPAQLKISPICRMAATCPDNRICLSDDDFQSCGGCPTGNTCPQGFHLDYEPIALPSQMVAWIETPAGVFQGTIYITAATGTFGIGNRAGRFDLNTGPGWPYGKRITTFPVWAHRHG